MKNDDIGCFIIAIFVFIIAVVFWFFVISPSITANEFEIKSEQQFRIACSDAGGTSLIDTDELGNVCVREFIKIE